MKKFLPKKSLFFSFLLGLAAALFAQDDSKSYIKYEHPREYIFDMKDASEQMFTGYNASIPQFEGTTSFTHLVSNDLPQEGDKITIVGNIKPSVNVEKLCITLIDKSNYLNLVNNVYTVIFDKLDKKTYSEFECSFILDHNCTKDISVKFFYGTVDNPFKVEQSYFSAKRVKTSTNTVAEEKAFKKAQKKKIPIVVVTSDFTEEKEEEPVVEEEIPEEEAEPEETVEEIEEEEIPEEETVEEIPEEPEEPEIDIEALEQERLAWEEAERLRIAEEKRKEEELLLKSMQTTTEDLLNKYKKEYLLDYAPEKVYELPSDELPEDGEIITNPNKADINGFTLLMKAAKNGNNWDVLNLLKAGADVNLKDKDGWTALMYAARYQEHTSIVEALIKAGSPVKARNNYNLSALILAASYNGNPEIIATLLEHYSSSEKEVMQAFIEMITNNNDSDRAKIAKIQAFLNKSFQINAFYNGKTPLMYAAQYSNSTNIIKTLLDGGAITNLRSAEGKTAFDYAQSNTLLQHDSIFWSLNIK